MTGFWQSVIDLEVDCECGWSGDVLGVEDRERMTLTWECRACGREVEEVPAHDDGHVSATFVLMCAGAALVFWGCLGRSAPIILTGLVLVAIITAAYLAADFWKAHR